MHIGTSSTLNVCLASFEQNKSPRDYIDYKRLQLYPFEFEIGNGAKASVIANLRFKRLH